MTPLPEDLDAQALAVGGCGRRLFASRCGVLARSAAGAERSRTRASNVFGWGLRGRGAMARLAGVVLGWMI